MSENTEEFSSNALVVINNEFTSTPIGLTKSASSTTNDVDITPRILCNELIVDPHKSKSLEKLDELSSLEREIAKMHHVDDPNLDLDDALLSSTSATHGENQIQIATNLKSCTGESDLSNGKNASIVVGCQETNLEDKLDAITSGETALEHEDLIAVLKGLDGNADDTHNISGSGDSIIEEGVTIEGEGEYQIMEVIDEDSNTTEDTTKPDIAVAANTSSSSSTTTPTTQTLNKTKTFGSTALTAQEERALALEQMECLKTAHRRRKQDIKPIKQIDPALDLVSTLEADWSENDDELVSETSTTESKPKLSTTNTKVVASATISKATGENKTNSALITSVVVLPSVTAIATSTTTSAASTTPPMSDVNVSPANKNSSTAEDINTTKSLPVEGAVNTKSEEETQVVPSQTGFRRTRIIKRKIIWDPDAPETTFSYAKLVKSNNNTKTKTEPTIKTSITKGSTTITQIKKETLPKAATVTTTSTTATKKTQRPTTPKVKKSASNINIEKTSSITAESTGLAKTTEEKEVIKSNNKTEEVETKASPSLETKSSSSTTSPAKRRSQTPVANSPGNSPGCSVGVRKRKNNELDRLMGDEGAVNMLNSLEKLEATLGAGEAKSTRPLMRSRAATICEKLPRKETTSPGRRTPTPTGTNQQQSNKTKRTPKSRASSSWDYVYKKKKQDFDDSLIIRRRSNSSYSSTTSLNRSSLDGPPATVSNNNTSNSSTKSNDSISLPPATTSDNELSKTPPSTSSNNKSSGSSKIRSTPTPPAATASGGKSFEFAKPESKKSQKRTKSPAATLTNDMKKAAPVASRRNARSPANSSEDKVKDVVKTPHAKSPNNLKDKKDTSSPISDVVVKKSSKVAQILFSTNKAKLNNTFTIQMLNKLVDILDRLASDPDCYVVVIGTNDAHFCQGIDITDLTTIAADKRKNYAVNLATSVKNYLKTLATYPKPLIAGVNGNLMNLGVIQLALFDVVIASDKTTFETPYAKMGQVPEGYCIWNNMNKIRGSFKTKLFWLCERIQSTEAALAGLVNKLTAANKVNDDAFATAKRIASLSAESYRGMKKTVINSHLDVIVSSLDEEFDTIIKQWTSSECLENLKKFLGHN
ncbi:serine-rich adhesin for platelets [Calliphora vicina]|uniref:serine-rich adhesin for platelets n=1 Tax=Calliphora vicina TaxID=7373 RepID=UPI00325AA965